MGLVIWCARFDSVRDRLAPQISIEQRGVDGVFQVRYIYGLESICVAHRYMPEGLYGQIEGNRGPESPNM